MLDFNFDLLKNTSRYTLFIQASVCEQFALICCFIQLNAEPKRCHFVCLKL